MKNDFDFIKEKFDSSGVKAPDSLDKDAVLAMLEDKQPAPIPLRPKRRWPAVVAVAASLVIVASLGIVLGSRFIGNKPQTAPPTTVIADIKSLQTFDSYNDVEDAVGSIRKLNQKKDSRMFEAINSDMAVDDYSKAGNSASAESGNASSSSHSETYKQVDGVDEADIIKTDGRYIYCVENRYNAALIKIFSADGDSSRLITTLDASKQSSSTADEAALSYSDAYYYDYRFTISDMYLRDHTLVLLCMDHRDAGETVTEAQVYDVSDINSIRFLGDHSQSGYLASSRMIGDTLYTVSSYYPYEDRVIPYCNEKEIPCNCIYSLPNPNTESFLVVSSFNTRDFSAQSESKALLGAVSDIYCNENNLYIYASHYDVDDDGWFSFFSSKVTTRIVKVNLDDGLEFTAFGEVKGYVKDQYALDEYSGNLRVATTCERNGKDVNNLYVLDENLSVIGSVNGFAKNESIKAVRYLGDTAYVITYEQTDPLFVIDLSDPAAPAILGEAKISGFSTMLIPIGDDLVLGLGYHTENEDYTDLEVQEGFKLALFDVSDKANPKVLDSKSYVEYSSEVQYNPKALVYNPDRDDYIIPLNYAHYGWRDYIDAEDTESADGASEDKDVIYGGMLNFTVRDGKIKVIEQYRCDRTNEIERCIYVGDTVYMTHRGENYDGDLTIETKKYQ